MAVPQEKEHLAAFNSFIPRYRARPTALLPFWHVAGSNKIKIKFT
jgi:demethoxyubiquinone hydroxylase (CLK1/Coq7/Cat5 family)